MPREACAQFRAQQGLQGCGPVWDPGKELFLPRRKERTGVMGARRRARRALGVSRESTPGEVWSFACLSLSPAVSGPYGTSKAPSDSHPPPAAHYLRTSAWSR